MSNDARRSSSQSVPQFGVIAGASALVLYGLFRRNKTGLALATAGGLVAYKQARSQTQSSKQTATAIFRVNATSNEAYRLWRNFENLPRFMAHLAAVRVLDDRRSEWTAKGPLDSCVRWSAEITEDKPNRRIAWRSLPGSQLETTDSRGSGSSWEALTITRLAGFKLASPAVKVAIVGGGVVGLCSALARNSPTASSSVSAAGSSPRGTVALTVPSVMYGP